MDAPARLILTRRLPDPEATAAFARALGGELRSGDVLALEGPIGAGKSHFARALIRHRLGRDEDVPSPSFTLVQTYEAGDTEIWHCDLYRLGHPDEVLELGLDTAFDTAITLIEWPDRLGPDLPARALRLRLDPDSAGDTRTARLSGPSPWADRLTALMDSADAP